MFIYYLIIAIAYVDVILWRNEKWILNLRCILWYLTGNYNDNVEYSDGQLMLKYTGGNDKCHQRYNYTTTLLFMCDHTRLGTDGPRYMPHHSTQCSYYFEWPTSLACLPFRFDACYCSLCHTAKWCSLVYLH